MLPVMCCTASYCTPTITLSQAFDHFSGHIFFLTVKFSKTYFQNASNEQCSMCGPAMETHTVHRPIGHSLISLIQQVLARSKTCLHPGETKSMLL